MELLKPECAHQSVLVAHTDNRDEQHFLKDLDCWCRPTAKCSKDGCECPVQDVTGRFIVHVHPVWEVVVQNEGISTRTIQ